MTTTVQYRQGDVLIEKIDKLPSGAKPVDCTKDGRVILAFGTATGHAHAFPLDKAELYHGEGGDRFLTLREGAVLSHDEHAPIETEPGIYKIVQQREYSPEAIRNVMD